MFGWTFFCVLLPSCTGINVLFRSECSKVSTIRCRWFRPSRCSWRCWLFWFLDVIWICRRKDLSFSRCGTVTKKCYFITDIKTCVTCTKCYIIMVTNMYLPHGGNMNIRCDLEQEKKKDFIKISKFSIWRQKGLTICKTSCLVSLLD